MLRQGKKRVQFSSYHNDDEYDGYFTYRPLSNLPTPPPSLSSSATQSPKNPLEDGNRLKPRYLGPATHLVNLIPAAASLATPSVPLVQAVLTRANLPLETTALAVCILDALDSKFALNWRLSCPLSALPSSKRHTLPSSGYPGSHLHIDSVHPELIILAALVLAAKFLDDRHSHARHYVSAWGGDLWSCEQLNITEWCIMENLGYRILPLCEEDLLSDAMVDMQLAARERSSGYGYVSPAYESCNEEGGSTCGMSDGRAVIGLGLSITPTETP
ncbi:uncharacterized protein DNG_01604 [Cephalotrichum gorgonifer]|uniref:Cyclin N-terminal domain-containing protein n=1 Tax=Cephalotrichum gorgonifer TaxID=2041049 RepID=A0AAE8MSX9_9PEZI|nr:uncharacterized protein DNG_01604 [Cephalotrichum gorgonifer]